MNNNNSGIKIALVILVILCLFQGCGIASMNDNLENLDEQMMQMNSDIQDLKARIRELEDVVAHNGIQMDVSYKMKEIDWENGNINVEFSIDLFDVTENTRLVINNEKGTYELTKSGSRFVGNVEYPIDANQYETIVYQYNGDLLESSETIDWIGAGSLMSEHIVCEFDGLASYGNGRLTLAGEVVYGVDISDTITAAKLVFRDEEIELRTHVKNVVEINFSKAVENPAEEKNGNRQIYVEIKTESGVIYRIYPNIFAYAFYQVNPDEECEEDIHQVNPDEECEVAVYQENWLIVTVPDGKTYEMLLYTE